MTENYWNKTKEQLIELIQKKDKQIDLMFKHIDFDTFDFKCSSMCVHENCQEECIKQYFKNKAEEDWLMEKSEDYWKGYMDKQNDAVQICKICKYRNKYIEIQRKAKAYNDIMQELNNLANNMAKDGLVGYADNIRDIIEAQSNKRIQ